MILSRKEMGELAFGMVGLFFAERILDSIFFTSCILRLAALFAWQIIQGLGAVFFHAQIFNHFIFYYLLPILRRGFFRVRHRQPPLG